LSSRGYGARFSFNADTDARLVGDLIHQPDSLFSFAGQDRKRLSSEDEKRKAEDVRGDA
jgi:hypothetical protein